MSEDDINDREDDNNTSNNEMTRKMFNSTDKDDKNYDTGNNESDNNQPDVKENDTNKTSKWQKTYAFENEKYNTIDQNNLKSNIKIVEKSPKGRFGRFEEEIGKGSFKRVYRGYDYEEGREIAWNIINTVDITNKVLNQVYEEINILKMIKHPQIINYISGWFNAERNQLIIISELFTGGSLNQYLHKIKYPKLKVIKNWSKEILKGLKYLHEQEKPIIHRDIKCDNIFINSHEGCIKIGDLGFSCVLKNEFANSFSGTLEFMAPEVYKGKYGVKADIYSFGMCLLEMVTLEKPYKEFKNICETFEGIKNNILPQSLDTIMNNTVKDFINLCIKSSEEERPTADELLQLEFFNDITSEENNFPVKLNTKDFEESTKKREKEITTNEKSDKINETYLGRISSKMLENKNNIKSDKNLSRYHNNGGSNANNNTNNTNQNFFNVVNTVKHNNTNTNIINSLFPNSPPLENNNNGNKSSHDNINLNSKLSNVPIVTSLNNQNNNNQNNIIQNNNIQNPNNQNNITVPNKYSISNCNIPVPSILHDHKAKPVIPKDSSYIKNTKQNNFTFKSPDKISYSGEVNFDPNKKMTEPNSQRSSDLTNINVDNKDNICNQVIVSPNMSQSQSQLRASTNTNSSTSSHIYNKIPKVLSYDKLETMLETSSESCGDLDSDRSDSHNRYSKQKSNGLDFIYEKQKKKKNKKKNKQHFQEKKSRFVLNILDEKETLEEKDLIHISLIRDSFPLNSKNKHLIKFSYNLLTDTSEGIVSELKEEIGLSQIEIIDLNKDLNSLVNNFKDRPEKQEKSISNSTKTTIPTKSSNNNINYYSNNQNPNYITVNNTESKENGSTEDIVVELPLNIPLINPLSTLNTIGTGTGSKQNTSGIISELSSSNYTNIINNTNNSGNKNGSSKTLKTVKQDKQEKQEKDKQERQDKQADMSYDIIFKQMENYITKGYNIMNLKKEIDSMPNNETKERAIKKFEMLKLFLQEFKK